MRNKRETDISQYKKDIQQNELSEKADGGVKRFFRGFGKFLITVCSVCLVALLITGISLAVYIFTIASEPTGIDLKAKSMNQTSRIYIQNEDTKEFKEYQKLYDTENRIWVDNQDIPQAMIDTQVNRMVEDFAMRLQQQGLSVEQYFQYTGLTPDKIMEDMKPEAVKRIKNSLVLEAIAKAENIEVSDEEFEDELKKMADMYKMEVEKIKEFMQDAEAKQMRDDIAVQKAVDLIVSSAVEK